jgi:hypothetical protein
MGTRLNWPQSGEPAGPARGKKSNRPQKTQLYRIQKNDAAV